MSVERPISVVLQDIVHNIQAMVRSEIRLAKTEVREELTKTRSAGLALLAGAFSGVFCVLFVLLAVFFGLRLAMPGWAAALCVAAATGIVALSLITGAVKRFRMINAAAPKTVASLKENVEWAKQQIK